MLVLVLAVGIIVPIILHNRHKSTEEEETIDKLKQCLNNTEITEDITELVIPSDHCNTDVTVINLGRFKKLKNLTIDDNTFGEVEEVKLDGLQELERVIIGSNNFRNRNGTFILKNCLSVKQLVIGNNSFTDYNGFEVRETPSLEEIIIGDSCFGNVEDMSIVGMRKVEKVSIGENSFSNREGSFALIDCEVVKEIRVGDNSFANYNECNIRSTPLLELIEIGNGCFRNVGSMEITGMQKLNRLEIGEDSFSQLDFDDFPSSQSVELAADDAPHFRLYDCPSLKELLIGSFSFSGYSVCEIHSLSSIELIAIGGSCFVASSLELLGLCKRGS